MEVSSHVRSSRQDDVGQPFCSSKQRVVVGFSDKNDALLKIDDVSINFQKVCQRLLLLIVEKLQNFFGHPLRNHPRVGNGLQHLPGADLHR